MTLAAVASFQPVYRKEYLDRLAALPPKPAFTPEFWTTVHDAVQEQLGRLETAVRRRLAGIRVDSGRTRGNKFFLFSYRTFSLPDSGLDPVVVGMTFTPAHQGVRVEADISGEQSGDCLVSVPCKTVAQSRDELLATARESAQQLCQSAEAVANALKDPSRGFE